MVLAEFFVFSEKFDKWLSVFLPGIADSAPD